MAPLVLRKWLEALGVAPRVAGQAAAQLGTERAVQRVWAKEAEVGQEREHHVEIDAAGGRSAQLRLGSS
jgi:hypothetical protein